MDKQQFIKKAKESVVRAVHDDFPVDFVTTMFSPDDFYVVWFVKVLQNWKALVSTDVVPGLYFEVTYNGDKKETYVDWYTKRSNTVYKDDA